MKLYRIHKSLFDTVEDHYANDHDHYHETKAIEQLHAIHQTRAQEGIAEGVRWRLQLT